MKNTLQWCRIRAFLMQVKYDDSCSVNRPGHWQDPWNVTVRAADPASWHLSFLYPSQETISWPGFLKFPIPSLKY